MMNNPMNRPPCLVCDNPEHTTDDCSFYEDEIDEDGSRGVDYLEDTPCPQCGEAMNEVLVDGAVEYRCDDCNVTLR